MHTWSICQSNLQILQRKLQHRPGSDTNTPNTQHHTDRTHSATGARGSLQPGFNQVIPLHQRAPWCDVSLTSLTSWRGKPLHQGSSHSVHAAQRYKQYDAAVRSTPVTHRKRYIALQTGADPIVVKPACCLPWASTGMAPQHRLRYQSHTHADTHIHMPKGAPAQGMGHAYEGCRAWHGQTLFIVLLLCCEGGKAWPFYIISMSSRPLMAVLYHIHVLKALDGCSISYPCPHDL